MNKIIFGSLVTLISAFHLHAQELEYVDLRDREMSVHLSIGSNNFGAGFAKKINQENNFLFTIEKTISNSGNGFRLFYGPNLNSRSKQHGMKGKAEVHHYIHPRSWIGMAGVFHYFHEANSWIGYDARNNEHGFEALVGFCDKAGFVSGEFCFGYRSFVSLRTYRNNTWVVDPPQLDIRRWVDPSFTLSIYLNIFELI